MRARTISQKLTFLTGLGVLGLLVLATVELSWEKSGLLDDRQVKTRQLVETAHSLVAHYQGLAAKGQMPEDQAKRDAMAAVQSLRYNEKEYFWINDLKPTMLMHPIKPELNGKDLSEFKDPNGKLLFVEFARVAKAQGAGFVDYLWPKPGQEAPVRKISYVKLFEPWGWVVGSGIYVDDVDGIFWRHALSALGLVALIGAALTLLMQRVGRGIARPVIALRDTMREVVQKNALGLRVTVNGQDEVAEAGEAFNGLIQSFQETIRLEQKAANTLSGSSHTLSSTASELARHANDQAEAAGAGASAIEQVTVSINSVAEHAEEVRALADTSLARTEEGKASLVTLARGIDDAAHSVNEIAQSLGQFVHNTQQITQMTKQVSEIAEQTNLLALNAAIEAARAGEQGRGFAVVADEVRKLAEKSAASAREIDAITKTIGNQSGVVESTMHRGLESLHASQASMEAVSEVLNRAGEAVSQGRAGVEQISASVREQSSAIQDVARTVERLASISESNRVSSQATFAAADELKTMTGEMHAAVARFKI